MGDIREAELIQLGKKIDTEIDAWHTQGLDPQVNWQPNILVLSVRLDTLVQIVQENLEIDDMEFQLRYRKNMLRILQSMRQTLEEQKKQAGPVIDIFRGMPHDLNGGLH
jgi:hypothetical protein